MITSFEALNNLFAEIDSKLTGKVNIYTIGGAALLFSKLKSFTKDIDLIVKSKGEYDFFISALVELGFKDTAVTEGAYMLNISSTKERGDARIDLFLDKVCGKMHLSDNMASRAKAIFTGKNLGVHICANEDVFLFKTITLREGDSQDCEELIKRGLDWKVVFEEMQAQIKQGDQKWITHIGERLEELEDKGFSIPILKEVQKETIKYYELLDEATKK